MARPRKQTVDYFPHDTDAKDGRTLTILQAKFGNDGYAFWFKSLELLGRSEGHYYSFADPSDMEYLQAVTGISSRETVVSILETLVTLKAIDEELYQSGVIWCQNFVDRVADVYSDRVVDMPERPVFLVSGDNNPVSPPINGVSSTGNPQTKLNKTKLNNIKENEDAPEGEDEEAVEIWDNVLEEVQGQVNNGLFRTYWQSTRAISYRDGILSVGVPSKNHAEYLTKNQLSLVECAIKSLKLSEVEVKFLVMNGDKPP